MIEPFDQVAICKQVEAQHGNQIRLNRCVHEYNSWTRLYRILNTDYWPLITDY
jgi:hypothetical protein